MKIRLLAVALIVSPILSSSPVMAAETPEAAEKGACREDVKKFCANIQPGGGRIARCLRQNEKDLSKGCQDARVAAREKAKERAKEIKAACEGDAQKFCADVQPGGGRILGCLKKNNDQLTEACRATLPKRGAVAPKPASN